jgi:hypothetical protein
VRPKGVQRGAGIALLLIRERGLRKVPHFFLPLPSRESRNAFKETAVCYKPYAKYFGFEAFTEVAMEMVVMGYNAV